MIDYTHHRYRIELLHRQTEAEKYFWKQILQPCLCESFPDHQHAVTKQHAIPHHKGFYIIDFYIGKLKVGFEIDGGYHWKDTQLNKDLHRDEFLRTEHGVCIYHFPNSRVLEEPASVKEELIKILRQRVAAKRLYKIRKMARYHGWKNLNPRKVIPASERK
jgi:very-short-patch-repair endonuclease